MTVGEPGQRAGQPSMWVDAGDLAVFNQRGDDRPVVTALIRVREQRVFVIQGQGSDRPLDDIGVELDAVTWRSRASK